MAHYAFITSSTDGSLPVVTQVIVGRDEDDLEPGIESWEAYFTEQGNGRAIRTSYNTYGGVHYTDGEPSADQSKALRFNYAGIGYTYDEGRDAFIPPRPFDSWILNEETCLWEAPIPYPQDGLVYSWDEASGDWIEVVEPSA